MSSASNKFISNEQAVPIIDSEVFKGHENNRFALGVFGPDDVISYTPGSLAEAYLKLRANVYVDQTGMLSEQTKRVDGTELDGDDERSTHFVVCENVLGRTAVFACMRLIEKTDIRDVLPIEDFFPYAFSKPVPEGGIEVSRFIIRHNEAKQARRAKIEMITSGMSHIVNNDLGPIYGVAEPGFERDLRLMRMPLTRIANPNFVEEYNDENLGFEIDKISLANRLGSEALSRMSISAGSFVYWGEPESLNIEKAS